MLFSQRFRNSTIVFVVILLLHSSASLVFSADSAELIKQIQKSFSPVKRHIVTQPQKAATELSETMALFEELKAADPENSQIPQLNEQITKFDEQLSKRLGKGVQPVSSTTAPPAPKKPEVTLSKAPLPAVSTPPATGVAEKLPSGVLSRIKKIDTSLEKAKKALANQSTQRAELEYKSAAGTYAEIQQRYQNTFPDNHPEIVALTKRMAEVNTQIETAASAEAGMAAAGQQAAESNKALADAWIEKMGPFITRDSDKYLDQTGWNKEAADFAKIRSNYGEAAKVMAEYRKVDFPLGKPMALQNTERSLQSVLDNLSETYAKEDTAKASEVWLSRLEPFVTSMGAKNLIVSFTSSVQMIEEQQKIFDEASKLFAQYLNTEFPQGKSPQLQRVEDELADRLAKFPETQQRSLNAQAGNAGDKLDQEINFLQNNSEWKTDTSKQPYFLSDERINDAQKLVDTAVSLLPAGDPGTAEIQNKMETLLTMNNERRKVHAARTRMLPDTFKGDGKNDIKEKAKALVVAKINGSTILRATIISEDWKEETVEEWTDTTKSARRIRTTRSVTAQVAAKKDDGDVRLYTLHVAKDRRADGSWGQLYGNLHSDLGDLMLEGNVNK